MATMRFLSKGALSADSTLRSIHPHEVLKESYRFFGIFRSQIKIMDQQVEVWKMFRQTQEKYVYFILSLSIAAVAFAVATTDRTAFKWSHVLLGLAVGSWLIAIYFGIRWNKWNISTLFANHELLRVQSGKHLTDMQIPPGYEAAAIEGIRKAMNTNADDLKNSFDRQGLAFYTGIFFFITWHLWEMLTATI